MDTSNELAAITKAMNMLEVEISRQQKYIAQHGESNDAGEYDQSWENYKKDAEYNLLKWDTMKQQRDKLKAA